MAAPSPNLVDEFEAAFQNCISSLLNQEHFNITDTEEVKTSVEQCIPRFLDTAKQLDSFFLQKLMVLAVHKPEQIIKEDTEELKGELMRKEMLVQKHYDKLQQWQLALSRLQGTPGSTPGLPQMAAGVQQGQLPPTGMSQPTGPQQQIGQAQPGPGTPTGGPPQHMGPPVPGPYSQGPLAFLEQTTSSIGRTDRR